MQRLIQHLPSPLALVVSVLGHAVVLAALANIPVVAAAHAEDLLQPRPGTQARVTHADAEQARIATVFTTRSPSAEEALAWAHPDNQVLQVLLVPETPAPVATASAN